MPIIPQFWDTLRIFEGSITQSEYFFVIWFILRLSQPGVQVMELEELIDVWSCGYIDVGDGCWIPNVLVTRFGCCRFEQDLDTSNITSNICSSHEHHILACSDVSDRLKCYQTMPKKCYVMLMWIENVGDKNGVKEK